MADNRPSRPSSGSEDVRVVQNAGAAWLEPGPGGFVVSNMTTLYGRSSPGKGKQQRDNVAQCD